MISLLKRFWNWITGRKEPDIEDDVALVFEKINKIDPLVDIIKNIPKEKVQNKESGIYSQMPGGTENIPVDSPDPLSVMAVNVPKARAAPLDPNRKLAIPTDATFKPEAIRLPEDELSQRILEKLDPRVLTMKERTDIPPEPLVSEYIKIKNN